MSPPVDSDRKLLAVYTSVEHLEIWHSGYTSGNMSISELCFTFLNRPAVLMLPKTTNVRS